MTAPIQGPDRYVYAFDVTSSDNEFQLSEDTDGDSLTDSAYDGSITPDRYWGYKDDGNGPSGFPSFLKVFEDELNRIATENNYEVSAATPDTSTLTNGGIQIQAINSSPAAFELQWGAVTDPIDPRWIGWRPGDTSTLASTSDSPSDSLISPHSIYGSWRPITAFSDDTATQKPLDEKRWLQTSSDDEINNTQVEYGASIRKRTVMYPHAPAACVRRNRAQDADYASQAGLPNGDTNNALYHLWQAASLGGGKEKVAIVHNDGDTDHTIDTLAYDYEIGFLTPQGARSTFSELYDIQKVRGELYDLEFTVALTTSEVSF
jgi:hypothetical protein